MHNNQIDLNHVDGVSYTIYKESQGGGWKAFVRLNDGVYTHRDFLLEKKAESKASGTECHFSSCGILAYDKKTSAWFPTFETPYHADFSSQEKERDLSLAMQQATKTFGLDKIIMAHLGEVGAQKIQKQREQLALVGLSEEQIDKILTRASAQRKKSVLIQRGKKIER